MQYREFHQDLFSVQNRPNTLLCHCISSDFALGAGIARIFNQKGVKDRLLKSYPEYRWQNKGCCLITNTGFLTANLVTKERYWHKPTIETMRQALLDMKQKLDSFPDIKTIAMPAIGCGLDRLNWTTVKQIIFAVFEDTDYIIELYTI